MREVQWGEMMGPWIREGERPSHEKNRDDQEEEKDRLSEIAIHS